MYPVRIFLLLLAIVVSLIADDVLEYVPGQDLQIPLRVSEQRENGRSRVIEFRDCTKIDVTQDWSSQDLFSEKHGNTLLLSLRKAPFSQQIQVFGDDGVHYTLFVFSSDRSEELSGSVVVYGKKADANGAHDPQLDLPEPYDSQVIRLTKHVYGHKLQPDVVSTEDFDKQLLKEGVRKVGRRILEKDSYSIMSIRIYRVKDVQCHMCIAQTKGDADQIIFPFQEVIVPRQIAILPRTFDFIDNQNPGIILRKGKPRILYIFSLAKD
jgi:hypothetical protein